MAGGAGFLGSHLVDYLVDERECDVLVLDNLEVGRREWVHPKARFVHCDITQSEAYLRSVLDGCAYAFNYASRPYVPDSYDRPLRTFEVNCMGAAQFINAAQSCVGILQVSSAEVYGFSPGRRINETFPVLPHSSYGASKAAIDAYCQCAWVERGTPVIALRQFNCIGARETHPYVVPAIISQLNKYLELPQATLTYEQGKQAAFAEAYKKPVVVRLGNNTKRDFLPARDAVRMAVEVLERGQFGDVYNCGSESAEKVYDIAMEVARIMGFASITVVPEESRRRKWEIWHLQSDSSKLYSIGVRKPEHTLYTALSEAVTWFNGNGRKWPWEQR